MKLSIQSLVQQQAILDQRIFDLHETSRIDTLMERILAMIVEVGELANETRCFKFWSIKPASDMEVIAQEFSDGIHFILSLGIDLGDDQSDVESIIVQGSLTQQFLLCFETISQLSRSFDLKTYRTAFGYYLGIGERLGLSEQEIIEHYNKKNQTNHKRQDENY